MSHTLRCDELTFPSPDIPSHADRRLLQNHMLLYIFAFFIPPLAVFMQTGVFGPEFIIDLILSCLFWFPGIVCEYPPVFGIHVVWIH
jgi:uncharacterized membrane protein YqaE (UPF0057 family)